MKKSLLGLVFVCILMTVPQAVAGDGDERFYVGIRFGRIDFFGESLEKGSEVIEMDPGPVYGAMIGYRLNDRFTLELNVDHFQDVDGDYTGMGFVGENYSNIGVVAVHLSLLAKMLPKWIFEPYVGAGGSYYFNDFEREDFFLSTTYQKMEMDNSFGWHLRVGTDIRVAESVALTLDAKYFSTEADFDWILATTGVGGTDTYSMDGITMTFGVKVLF